MFDGVFNAVFAKFLEEMEIEMDLLFENFFIFSIKSKDIGVRVSRLRGRDLYISDLCFRLLCDGVGSAASASASASTSVYGFVFGFGDDIVDG
jgi:hypothetical protein